jgi:phosphonate transport system permease protein
VLDEKDPPKDLLSMPSRSTQEHVFLEQLAQTPQSTLVKPFGTINWQILAPTLACFVLSAVFFTHTLDLGKATINLAFKFNVNIFAGLLVLLLGALSIVPKVLKSPQLLRDQRTITSIILLGLLVAFLLIGIIDLGNFDYTLDKVDVSSVVGFVLVIAMVVLAFFGSLSAIALVGVLFLWWAFSIQNFGFATLVDLFTSENGGRLLRALTPPNWSYFNRIIDPLMLTVQTAVCSSIIGIAVSLPLSVLAARNTSPHPFIYNVIRFIINMIRAIPSLILALIFIPFVGLGPAAGIIGLSIHSISILTKLYAEAFESVKPQPLEALNAVGANGVKTFRWGVFPQAFPLVASYSIFNWESNARDSTVVAFVGGGGIGFLLQANISLLDYANVAVMLIVLILTVSVLDRFSDFVRSKII